MMESTIGLLPAASPTCPPAHPPFPSPLKASHDAGRSLTNLLKRVVPLSPQQAHVSLPRLLKACAQSSALSPGKQLHALSMKLQLSTDLFVQTSLVSMYSSCAQLDYALRLFDRMPQRNVVAWTAAADACLRSSQPITAISISIQMLESGVEPDAFSLVSFLSACASVGALNLGRGAHARVVKALKQLTAFLGTALIDMYGKCGTVDDAVVVFKSMQRRSMNVQTWNSLLHGLAVHGLGAEAVLLFQEMELDHGGSVRPNEVTFLALLCGCAHSGLVEEGKLYFDIMRKKYGIEPTVKHYGCLVDLLSRAGMLDEAFELVTNMPIAPNHVVWGALLSACRIHGNVGMAEMVLDRITEGDPPSKDTSHYVIMSNIYRATGLLGNLAGVRTKVGNKPKGRSWIEVGRHVHDFGVGCDSSLHPNWVKIKAMLDELDVKLGKERGEDLENPHSEKVAVAFGLISTSAPTPIRISKNLRICDNCHSLMKSISEVYTREIVIRDCNRFHRFVGGLCSCRDYW